LFPQTRGLIVSYAPNNYSSTMRCTKIRESVLCARLSTYDPLKIVAVSNSSTGNRRAKGGAKSAVSTGDNVSDTSNQQLYEGDDPETDSAPSLSTGRLRSQQHMQSQQSGPRVRLLRARCCHDWSWLRRNCRSVSPLTDSCLPNIQLCTQSVAQALFICTSCKSTLDL
jgi:hypothetical protein